MPVKTTFTNILASTPDIVPVPDKPGLYIHNGYIKTPNQIVMGVNSSRAKNGFPLYIADDLAYIIDAI